MRCPRDSQSRSHYRAWHPLADSPLPANQSPREGEMTHLRLVDAPPALRCRAELVPQPPSASAAVLARWIDVSGTGPAGYVHGGLLMKLCDEVAWLTGTRHARGRVVTASVEHM